jgi:hypothetical protein
MLGRTVGTDPTFNPLVNLLPPFEVAHLIAEGLDGVDVTECAILKYRALQVSQQLTPHLCLADFVTGEDFGRHPVVPAAHPRLLHDHRGYGPNCCPRLHVDQAHSA